MKKNQKGFAPIVIVLVVVLVLAGGYFAYQTFSSRNNQAENKEKPASKDSVATGENQNLADEDSGDPSVIMPNLSGPAFAEYKAEVTRYSPKLPDYTLALSEITNLSAFEKKAAFSANQKNSLVKNNFFIAANSDKFYDRDENAYGGPFRVDDWVDLYKGIGGPYSPGSREPENSVFITSDFLLHVYHRLLEKEFENAEQAFFYKSLEEISNSLLKSSAASYNKISDREQKESFGRLSAYFLVSSSILGSAGDDYKQFKINNYVGDNASDTLEAVLGLTARLAKENGVSEPFQKLAEQEIGLIFNAKGLAESPLFGKYQTEAGLGMPEDYSQYIPRSHYAKNAILRNYFRAMMWYGRTNFLVKSPELTRDAANLSLLISNGDLDKWQSIYLPTAFFVGQSDDLNIDDYRQAINNTGFKVSDQGSIDKLQQELKKYKNPQIMSSAAVGNGVFDLTKEELQNKTKGFRFMGQRFTPDAFIFSTLTQGDEKTDPKTGQRLPSTPTALMVSTLMGSKASGTLLDDWIKTNAPQSDKVIADRMATLGGYFGKMGVSQWTQNIYWSWLYTLRSVAADDSDKTGYPMFVKNEDWQKKNLQCFLGSWTELKHDTLLYAKQSYAEMGAGGGDNLPKPVPKGYVEPNIEFFDRLISLANLSNDGLKKFGLLSDTFESRNQSLIESLKFYRKIAVVQLQNEKISEDDFEKLRLSAGSLNSVLAPIGAEDAMEKNARSALIADVHTDVAKKQILYEADGIPNYIYVAVKDVNGTRLTKGLVYSYYEFTNPLGKRLTDEDWQKSVYSDQSKMPPMADWSKALIK